MAGCAGQGQFFMVINTTRRSTQVHKKIIALAVASIASTTAFAQSNVQVYGIADVGAAHISPGGADSINKIDSGLFRTSRLGFKGTEDLGNGMKVIFVLEYRLNIDVNQGLGGGFISDAAGVQGSTSGSAREQYVGLAGDFGTLKGGRMNTTAFKWGIKYVTLGASIFDVTGDNAMWAGSRNNPLGDIRLSNAVAYHSPTWAGFSLDVNYARPIEAAATGNGHFDIAQLGLYYDKGPLSIGAVYDHGKGSGDATLALGSLAFARGAGFPPGATVFPYEDIDFKSSNLGASYDFGIFKLKATYQSDKFMNQDRNTVWGIGAEIPVFSKGTVHAVYSAANVKTLDDADSQGLSLAYTHALSKRTIAYAGYTWRGNDDAARSGIWAVAPAAGGSVKLFAAGLTHMF
jgi:predicted porin